MESGQSLTYEKFEPLITEQLQVLDLSNQSIMRFGLDYPPPPIEALFKIEDARCLLCLAAQRQCVKMKSFEKLIFNIIAPI